jgi:hypothetical protein
MFAKVIISFLMGLCVATLSGCGGQLYNVTPLPSSAPPDLSANNANGFNIAASGLDGDQSLERFEANLPLAGVIAVDVRLINQTAAAVDAGSLKFELRTAAGKSFKAIAPKQALKRVMKFYGDRFYRLDARKSTIDSYNALALPLSSPIATQEERRGLLFFEVQRNAAPPDGLTLVAAGAKPPVSVKVN